MDYAYNRKAFRSAAMLATVDPLAAAYNTCVLLELALKEHLQLCNTPLNKGHDLPDLIQRIGLRNTRLRVTMSAFKAQLSFVLGGLHSQSKDGTPRKVPSNSYPHIRYLRHTSDWANDSSSDTDIAQLNSLLRNILVQLSSKGGVAL